MMLTAEIPALIWIKRAEAGMLLPRLLSGGLIGLRRGHFVQFALIIRCDAFEPFTFSGVWSWLPPIFSPLLFVPPEMACATYPGTLLLAGPIDDFSQSS